MEGKKVFWLIEFVITGLFIDLLFFCFLVFCLLTVPRLFVFVRTSIIVCFFIVCSSSLLRCLRKALPRDCDLSFIF